MSPIVYQIGFYVFGGLLILLVILYAFNASVDRNFRKKMVPLLKNQKASIDKLEHEKENLSRKHAEIKKELNVLKNQIAIQDTEYERINLILKKGLFNRFRNPSGESIKQGSAKNRTLNVDPFFVEEATALENWFRFKYLKQQAENPHTEVTESLQRLSLQMNDEFTHKKLNFVCHLGEPVEVNLPQEIFDFVSLTFGRMIGKRSVNGNTVYFDTDKTGKKCLISLEDSGPGDNDQNLKSLLSDPWTPGNLPKMPDEELLPGLLARELIQVFQGNTWYSRIHEIGIKITYSIPLHI